MDTPIVANRRKNLKLWIELHYEGSQTKFVSATEINQGELSGLLRNKSFGEKKARNIEQVAQMPEKWLDNNNGNPQYNNNGSGIQQSIGNIGNLNNNVANGGTQYNVQMPNCDEQPLDTNAIQDKLIKVMPLLDIDQAVLYATSPQPDTLTIKENVKVAIFAPHSGRTFGLKMPDDSMLAPEIDCESIFKNDLLIIEPHIEPRDGDIVLACLSDSPNKKRGIVARLELDIQGNKQLVQVGRGKVAEPMPENAIICGVVIEIKRRFVSLDVLESRLKSYQQQGQQ